MSTDISTSAIAIDGNRNIYISGLSIGSYDFEGVALTHTSPFFGHFLVKYNADGEIQWGKIAGTINGYLSNHLASNGTDTVFFAGYFRDSNINFATVTNTNTGWDGFLMKFTNPTLDVMTFGAQTKAIYPNPVSSQFIS